MSKIKYGSIDENFPVAGRDNSSQGFRDNFNYIKTGLAVAATEISDIHNAVALLGPLERVDPLDSTKTISEVNNDFNKNLIYNAITNRMFPEVNISTTLPAAHLIDVQGDGWEYHKYTVSNNSVISLLNWPKDSEDNGVLGRIRLEFKSTSTTVSYNITFSGPANSKFMVDSTFTSAGITLPANTNSTVIDVWSFDKGNTIYLHKVGTFTQL